MREKTKTTWGMYIKSQMRFWVSLCLQHVKPHVSLLAHGLLRLAKQSNQSELCIWISFGKTLFTLPKVDFCSSWFLFCPQPSLLTAKMRETWVEVTMAEPKSISTTMSDDMKRFKTKNLNSDLLKIFNPCLKVVGWYHDFQRSCPSLTYADLWPSTRLFQVFQNWSMAEQ